MKKLLLLGAVLSVSILSGCAATGENSVDLAGIDFNTLSCDQIDTVFKDYKTKVDSGDTITGLISLVNPSAEATAKQAKASAMTIYNTAKEKAQPVLKVKGCSINI